MISEPIARSQQTMHLSCVEINTITKLTETSFHVTEINYDYSQVPQKDFQAYGTFAQTVHLSCAEMNTLSKQT
jgi:hypothetical protein